MTHFTTVSTSDRVALRDLVRFGVMSDDQLARRYSTTAEGLARVPELKDTGLLNEWWETLEGARVFSPTRSAFLLAKVPGLRPRPTYTRHLVHDVAVVDLADALLAEDANVQFVAEYEVRPFLEHIAPRHTRRDDDRHRPDGLLVKGNQRIAIELEHTTKATGRYEQISGWFVREWRVDSVRWYIDVPGILQRLQLVNEQHGFDRDMRIELLPFPAGVHVRQRSGPYRP